MRVNVISPGHIDTPILDDLQQGEALGKMKKEMANDGRSAGWETRTRLPKQYHSSRPIRPAMWRGRKFTSMAAWRESKPQNAIPGCRRPTRAKSPRFHSSESGP